MTHLKKCDLKMCNNSEYNIQIIKKKHSWSLEKKISGLGLHFNKNLIANNFLNISGKFIEFIICIRVMSSYIWMNMIFFKRLKKVI